MAKAVFLVISLAIAFFHSANAETPTIFIFGDSTADVGTNNFLPGSKFRVNFPPNGIDLPDSKPTGRFSNGLNSADFLAMLLGHKRSPPPFLSLKSSSAVTKKSFEGINFASGGSGLLDLTGQTMLTLMNSGKEENSDDVLHKKIKNVIPLGDQIEQFKTVLGKLVATFGKAETEKFLSKSLFFISTGSNDIVGYYHHSGAKIPKQAFISSLGLAYDKHLRALLNLGVKKFGIISIPSLGCCPSQRVFNATGGCLEELNEYARAFYAIMEALLRKLSSEYKDMKYSLGNTYEMTINVIENPVTFNLTDVKTACCGAGKFNAEAFCDPKANLCPNRHEYLFWDLFHPTQDASKLAALTLYSGGQRFVTPINFSQLAAA